MCDERDTRDSATGSRLFVAAPRCRAEREPRRRRSGSLNGDLHLYLALSSNHRSEHQLRRCPNLRGPT
jgi:hypothetical protein